LRKSPSSRATKKNAPAKDRGCKKVARFKVQVARLKKQSHKDLEIFKRSYAISLEIYKVSASFPKEERFAITDQLRRSSSSICANIAEGYGRQLTSNSDFKRFLIIAKGSCQETQVWIDYCHDLSFIGSQTAERWALEYEEISRMLYAFIKQLET
jgi:four helix bundle protein